MSARAPFGPTASRPAALHRAIRLAAWTALLLAGTALPAWAADPGVQLGDVGDHGRIVFTFAHWPGYHYSREGDVATLTFNGNASIGEVTGTTRNVVEVEGGDGQASITVEPGSRLETRHRGRDLVVDVFAGNGRAARRPEPRQAAQANAAPATAPRVAEAAQAAAKPVAAPARSAEAPPTVPAPTAALTALAATATPAGIATPAPSPLAPALGAAAPMPSSPPPAMAQATEHPAAPPPTPPPGEATTATTDPLAIAAIPAALPPGAPGSAIVVPFGKTVGAAAYRQGEDAVVVFDERRPIDLSGVLADPTFAAARIAQLPDATTLVLRLPGASALRLSRRADGWLVAAVPSASPTPIVPASTGDSLTLPADAPGQVVAVPDARTGGTLLVGTQRTGGQAVVSRRQVPEFVLHRSWQGVVVEPTSDRIELRPVPEGFRLSASGRPLEFAPTPDSAHAMADAASLTRRFDFPDLPVDMLRLRMERQVATAAQAPAMARLAPRLVVAQTMIALGLGAEAQSVLQLAAAEAPQEAANPDLVGLTAIAALLAGRTEEAEGLLAPALSGTDEVTLWRAILGARQHEGAADAASVFAAEMPLLLSYPDALRQRLLPLAAETMLAGGQVPAARALLARLPREPTLAFARAMALQQAGDVDGALAAYAVLARDRDRLLHARAEAAATELQLSSGRIDAAAAATALSDQLASWRGGEREQRMRMRLVAVQMQAHAWRAALATLRETETLFPEARAEIRERVAAVFDQLLQQPDAGLSSLDLVALADENADLLPQGATGDRLAGLLAEKLVALDLPRRAEPVLAKLAAAAAPGPGRALLGQRLAEMRLETGNAAGAVAALTGSDSPGLPAPLVAARTLVLARAEGRLGDRNGALALLAGLGTPAASDERAKMLADAHDWPAAEAVLAGMVASNPPTGALDGRQQDLLLRLAGAAAQAGDAVQLARIHTEAPRITGPRGEMFRLLVAAPVQGPADLARAAGETVLARAVPAGLQAMTSR